MKVVLCKVVLCDGDEIFPRDVGGVTDIGWRLTRENVLVSICCHGVDRPDLSVLLEATWVGKVGAYGGESRWKNCVPFKSGEMQNVV